ncbi:M56 family metallopeptidase [Fulvivirga kasyanovii]|uniref:TonB family protein n=1 Tax=Fulvivirga kasyanovii TaxID=396812 RepID=A0ABW9RK77_9BACT|nr:TonB family protein [Fulvivirga kasyanovii]MTI24489.1 TonB family protein [Fulvivirga kasyanovii]
MSSYINYLLEANICLLIFGLFYYLVLRNDTHFRFSRYYLLGSAALTLVIPLLHFNNPFTGDNAIPLVNDLQAITLPELIINLNTNPATEINGEAGVWSLPMIIALVYLGVILVMLTLFLYQVYQIISFKRLKKDVTVRHGDHMVIPTDGQLPTFAFFNMIFFDNTAPLSKTEKEKIMEHEAVHVSQHHTLDIMVMELVKILFWINPVAWWMHKSLRDVHEYLADQSIIKYADSESYSSLLAKMALRQMSLSVGHHFNKSMTLKRIKMIKSPKTKFKNWKWASMIVVTALVVTVFSCNDVNEVMETASQKQIPAELEPELKRLKEQYPQAEFAYIETDAENKVKLEKLGKLDPKTIAYTKEWKETGMIGIIISKSGELMKMPDADGAFWVVEETAEPYGGFEALYAKLAEALKYPEQARKLGIEGKVYISFIVDTDGSLTNIKVAKGIGGGCDEAALEAMKTIEPFKPAKQRGKKVKQKLVLPITFKLDDDTASSKVDQEEIVTVKEEFKVSINRDGLKVSGKVTKPDGKPMPGTNVVIKGTNSGTVCDLDGTFKLTAFKETDELVISFVGFETQTIALADY